MKYEKPRLVDIRLNETEGNPDCANGSVVADACTSGGTVTKGCNQGGIPTVIACSVGGGFV